MIQSYDSATFQVSNYVEDIFWGIIDEFYGGFPYLLVNEVPRGGEGQLIFDLIDITHTAFNSARPLPNMLVLSDFNALKIGEITNNIGSITFTIDTLEIAAENSVMIDIKPNDFPNFVNLDSRGVIPVAVMTTSTFDATNVDPITVHFGRSGLEAATDRWSVEDVNVDGDLDMLLFFRIQETGISCGDDTARLTGLTLGGDTIEGDDSILTLVGRGC